jgi:hypothetical protein
MTVLGILVGVRTLSFTAITSVQYNRISGCIPPCEPNNVIHEPEAFVGITGKEGGFFQHCGLPRSS